MTFARTKNVLLVICVFVALSGVARWILVAPKIQTPTSFSTDYYRQKDVQRILNRVNTEFQQQWQRLGVSPAGEANNLLVARRLSLGLMGTVPSLEEIRQIQQQPEDQQINWWVSRILEDNRYHDYVAERLARALVGTENGPFIIYRRRRFVSWLSEQMAANVPYDQLVYQLLTDEGLWTDSPAVNFVTVTTDQNGTDHPDPIRLAGRTTRSLLGLRIDCLQCHDDFLGSMNLGDRQNIEGGTQQHFHQMAAFYSEVRNSLGGVRDRKDSEPYEYKYLDAQSEVLVKPSVPFAEALVPSSGNRREQLAGWVTHKDNRQFARAIVNRMWAIMAGKPLVEPIDSIPLFDEMPAGMTPLVDDFVENKFDLQRLIRIIAMTNAYRMKSSTDSEISKSQINSWAVFPRTRLRPEQVAGSIIQSTSLSAIDSTAHALVRLIRFGQENDFVERYGDRGENEFDPGTETVTQRLLLLNGELVQQRVTENLNAPNRIASLSPDDKIAIQTAFLATLSRYPDSFEIEYFKARLIDSPDKSVALQDLFWVLINLDEFGHNH